MALIFLCPSEISRCPMICFQQCQFYKIEAFSLKFCIILWEQTDTFPSLKCVSCLRGRCFYFEQVTGKKLLLKSTAKRRQSIRFSDTDNLFLLINHEDAGLSAWKTSSMNHVITSALFFKNNMNNLGCLFYCKEQVLIWPTCMPPPAQTVRVPQLSSHAQGSSGKRMSLLSRCSWWFWRTAVINRHLFLPLKNPTAIYFLLPQRTFTPLLSPCKSPAGWTCQSSDTVPSLGARGSVTLGTRLRQGGKTLRGSGRDRETLQYCTIYS